MCSGLLYFLRGISHFRDRNDNLRCAVCGSFFTFTKELGSRLPSIPSTTSSSSRIISSIVSPNHKLGMGCEKSCPFQSTFIAPMQSTKQFSSQLLSSSIGVSGGNAGVNNT